MEGEIFDPIARCAHQQNPGHVGRTHREEAAVGFEPTNTSFANWRLRPLGYAAHMRATSSTVYNPPADGSRKFAEALWTLVLGRHMGYNDRVILIYRPPRVSLPLPHQNAGASLPVAGLGSP